MFVTVYWIGCGLRRVVAVVVYCASIEFVMILISVILIGWILI